MAFFRGLTGAARELTRDVLAGVVGAVFPVYFLPVIEVRLAATTSSFFNFHLYGSTGGGCLYLLGVLLVLYATLLRGRGDKHDKWGTARGQRWTLCTQLFSGSVCFLPPLWGPFDAPVAVSSIACSFSEQLSPVVAW